MISQPAVSYRWALLLVAVVLASIAGGHATAVEPPSFGGRYPHLAVSNAQGECGIGAVVPWAGRLWFITYAPHQPAGSDDKLYEVDPSLAIKARSESVGGTPAARFIHAETKQLVIGPYVIDEQGQVRAVPPTAMYGRLTAASRHRTDPAHKVHVYDMEGLLYELDMTSLEPALMVARAVPGWHGKGMYCGQGVVVVANNGEHPTGTVDRFKPFRYEVPNTRNAPEEAGALAEWDGTQWRLIRRRQFTDVTGPGGIKGPPSADAPLWAIGWDEKSVLLMVRDAADTAAGREPWHTFRLPKACSSYDGDHGWHTEWPRIREVVLATDGSPAKFVLTMHGGWYDFPGTFSATSTRGIRPICSHLKITGDVAPWTVAGRPAIVFGCDDTATSGFKSEFQNTRNDLVGRSNSNLWFTTWEGLRDLGEPAGFGYAWRAEPVQAGTPSDPLLLAGAGGYTHRSVHLAHESDSPVTFIITAGGDGSWWEITRVTVPAKAAAHAILPGDVQGDWVRVTTDRDAAGATAVFRYGTRGGLRQEPALFAGLVDAGSREPWIGAVVRSGSDESLPLDVLATAVDPATAGSNPPHTWRISGGLAIERLDEKDPAAVLLREKAVPEDPTVTFDAASVILTEGPKQFRLPKPLDPAIAADYEQPFATGWPRGLREVATERSLLNAAGTFYVLPRVTSGGAAKIQPVCSHGKRITDFCSWRGLLVLGGVRQAAASSGARIIGGVSDTTAGDPAPAVWVGDIDELWKFPRPTGRGGPWHETAVTPDTPSDPYLMGGYDAKSLELAHDGTGTVRVTVEIDPTGDGHWFRYAAFDVPAGERLTHEFPTGYLAQWVRFTADAACTASATLTYR